ncbi:MAG: hypothetical protein U0230_15630 [Polyangiales bacterium]
MELPTIVLLSVLVFGGLIVAYSIKTFRHMRLDTVRLLPGEQVLFELHDVKFSELPYRAAHYTSFYFQTCLVRVTNHRLLLAQQALIGKDPATAVIAFALYRTPIPEGFGTSYLDGFRSFVVDKEEILMETVQGHKVISLFPESPGPNLPIKIMLETHERDRLALYFGRPSLIPPPGSPSRPPSMPPPAGIPSA